MPFPIRFAKAAQGWGELHSPGSAQTAWENLIPEWLAALQNGHFTLINRAGIAFPLFFPFHPGDPNIPEILIQTKRANAIRLCVTLPVYRCKPV